jgi:hypothetical protein
MSAARYEKEVNTWPDTTEAFGEPVRDSRGRSGIASSCAASPAPSASTPDAAQEQQHLPWYDPLRREAEVICYDEACCEQMLASVISV